MIAINNDLRCTKCKMLFDPDQDHDCEKVLLQAKVQTLGERLAVAERLLANSKPFVVIIGHYLYQTQSSEENVADAEKARELDSQIQAFLANAQDGEWEWVTVRREDVEAALGLWVEAEHCQEKVNRLKAALSSYHKETL